MRKPTKKASRKAASKQPTTKYRMSLSTVFEELEYARKMIEGTSQLLYFFSHCHTVHDMGEILHVNNGRVMALDACAIFRKEKLEQVKQDVDALHEEAKRQRESYQEEALRQFKAGERAGRRRRRA